MTLELVEALLGSGVTAAVIGLVIVPTVKSAIATAVQQAAARELELLKHELSTTLADRARRAAYVSDQLRELYGPLAFRLEEGAVVLEANQSVMKAYSEYFKYPQGLGAGRKDEMELVLDRGNAYVDKLIESNQKGVILLREKWGWLDADDIPAAIRYVTDVARLEVEQADGKKLPGLMYYEDGMGESALKPPGLFRPEFANRIRGKLQQKQQELAAIQTLEITRESRNAETTP